MRKTSNSFAWPLVGLCVLGTFSILASFSYGRYAPEHPQHGYTAAQVQRMDSFVAVQLDQVRAKPVAPKHMSKAAQAVVNVAKPGLLHPKTKTEWADAVADVWNLDEFKRGSK